MPSDYNSRRRSMECSSLSTKSSTSSVLKICVLGGSSVGKSSIIKRFVYNDYPEKHEPTVEELHRVDYNFNMSSNLVLDILDTSGSYEFPAMRRLAISKSDAFILVYSIDSLESFNEIQRLKDQIIEEKMSSKREESTKLDQLNRIKFNDSNNTINENPIIIVVGNKADIDEVDRKVSKEIAENLISFDWEIGFIESSAKNNDNIIEIFQKILQLTKTPYYLTHEIINKRRQSLPANLFKKISEQEKRRTSCVLS